jgi:hypothetical protein
MCRKAVKCDAGFTLGITQLFYRASNRIRQFFERMVSGNSSKFRSLKGNKTCQKVFNFMSSNNFLDVRGK